jgi:hypothetical protein
MNPAKTILVFLLACALAPIAARAGECMPINVRNPEGNYVVPGVMGDIVYRRVNGQELALDAYMQKHGRKRTRQSRRRLRRHHARRRAARDGELGRPSRMDGLQNEAGRMAQSETRPAKIIEDLLIAECGTRIDSRRPISCKRRRNKSKILGTNKSAFRIPHSAIRRSSILDGYFDSGILK